MECYFDDLESVGVVDALPVCEDCAVVAEDSGYEVQYGDDGLCSITQVNVEV
jgi:hypothetical protein